MHPPSARPPLQPIALLLIAIVVARPAQAQELPGETEFPGAIVRRPPRPAPPPEARGPCTIELSLKVRPRGASLLVTAQARNRSRAPVTLHTAEYCGGGGPAIFTGLVPGYDYYGACRRGPCLQSTGVAHFTLPPGATRTLTEVQLSPDGDGCAPALPPGRYALSFDLPGQEEGVRVCRPRRPHVLVRRPPRLPPPVEPVPVEPAPAPRSPHPEPRCPPMEPCGIYCPYGSAHDANGCPQCACNPDPMRAPVRPGPGAR